MATRRRTPGSKRSRYTVQGAEVQLPKGKLAGKARTKTATTDVERGQTVTNTRDRYLPNGIDAIRTRASVNEIIKLLMTEDGLFSSAADSMVSLAGNTGFRLAGFEPGGAMSAGVMTAAYAVIDAIDTQSDYATGYNDKPSLRTVTATLLNNVVQTGGCGAELVLDDGFHPHKVVAVDYASIAWKSDGQGGRYPTQDGGNLELNYPTIFLSELNRHAGEAYAVSPLRSGIENTILFQEYVNDTRRSVNRVGHSRLVASIVAEKVHEAAPESIKQDEAKLREWMQRHYDAVDDALKGLEPEDALIGWDSVEFHIEDTGGSKADYASLLSTLGNLTGASLKTPAAVTGLRAEGGQGLSNAETLVYLQTVDAIRVPVEEVFSRWLTLAVRLLGIDGYVRFEFKPVNLRPEDELEAYRTTRQQRVLTLLSFGVINDARACFELGLRPQELQELLAGTRFYATKASNNDEAERETSSGRALNPGTPTKAGGDSQ